MKIMNNARWIFLFSFFSPSIFLTAKSASGHGGQQPIQAVKKNLPRPDSTLNVLDHQTNSTIRQRQPG